MRLTKNDMARVIVTALYNMKSLAAVDHPEVVIRARKGTTETLSHQHKLAVAAIQSVISRRGNCPKCGEDSLPKRLTGSDNGLCDDCLGDHLDLTDI